MPDGGQTGGRGSGGASILDRLIRFCLENIIVVLLGVVLVAVTGVMVAPFDWQSSFLPRNPVPVDAIPDIGPNQQIVFTKWPGRSPQDVEDQITYPLTTALLGLPNVQTIRSSSAFGFSSIYIIFEDGVDFYWSRSRVLEKLNSLPSGTLPEGVQPSLGPDSTAMGQIFWYTLEGRGPDGHPAGGWDPQELRSIQDWQVRYALQSVEGISEVASVGGYVKEYQIDVDPDAMRAYDVTLDQVFGSVRSSNVDVGARTIEVNRVEYVIRGLGFIESVSDIENTVVRANRNVPVYVKNVANVHLGPALRRGALDKDGAEAAGGVVVVRYGYNPLAAIKNVKDKIEEISPGLPAKVVVDYEKINRPDVIRFARARGFEAYASPDLNHDAWLQWLRSTPRNRWPSWVTTSQVTVVPFYDRTELIHETLGTLNEALSLEVLVTTIVVIVSVLHLRSALLITGALPLAVLICFIAMKALGVDANIVSLSGIAIAIGTIVDMSIIVCENTLRHLRRAEPEGSRLKREVVFTATSEVGGAVLTAVATTIISFMPVFFMIGSEGKLFRPLAFTKTFALVASVIVALAVVPAGAYLLFNTRARRSTLKRVFMVGLLAAGLVLRFWLGWVWAPLIMVLIGGYNALEDYLPGWLRGIGPWATNGLAVAVVGYLLTKAWLPLGPERAFLRNLVFVGGIIGGLLLFFKIVQRVYGPALRWCLAHKVAFLVVPALLVLFGGYVWLGPGAVFGPVQKVSSDALATPEEAETLKEAGLAEQRGHNLVWTRGSLGMEEKELRQRLDGLALEGHEQLLASWKEKKSLLKLQKRTWGRPDFVRDEPLGTKLRWTLARDWQGVGKEFMPPLDEGSFLYMPTTMPHASIGEALDVLRKQDAAFRAIPEIKSAVGKIGRAETPLDPAPISMIETVITSKSEYVTDSAGHRKRFLYDELSGEFIRDEDGELIPDPDGMPFRQWRDHIRSADDIWKEIEKAGRIPGATSAPKLQPIATRLIMLQSGMRAPMGVKVKGPDLETIEQVGLELERLLKEVPSVKPATVVADRIVGKPYLEVDIDRRAIARYGISVRRLQNVVEVAIGGRRITTTVEGRERYPVRVRYMRELRDQIESLGEILVSAPDGTQVPLGQLAEVRYVRGPMVIKSEDTFLVGYVTFDKKAGYAEVDVVQQARAYLEQKRESGNFNVPAGVSYKFAGSFESQVRARKTLSVILPLALFFIFLILYMQFRSVPTTMLVFSGIVVAWAGGFMLIWFYNQPWFMDFAVFGVNMRDLFQMPAVDPLTGMLSSKVNLSVAVWVGFLALFGIASDNGVVIATYLDQSFERRRIKSVDDIREATVAGAVRRIRPCLMTSATTILALLPVLTSAGRGSDVMIPMAIPSFGGMLVVLVTVFTVPVLYCAIQETKHRFGLGRLYSMGEDAGPAAD